MTYYDESPRRQLQELKRLAWEDQGQKHWEWADRVEEYSSCSMTDPEDRLNALAGVGHDVTCGPPKIILMCKVLRKRVVRLNEMGSGTADLAVTVRNRE